MSEISDCFQQAKAFIVVPKKPALSYNLSREKYICCAIAVTQCSVSVQDTCRRIVESRLQGFFTLEGWLKQHHDVEGCARDELDPKIQRTRSNWLNSLIKEWK